MGEIAQQRPPSGVCTWVKLRTENLAGVIRNGRKRSLSLVPTTENPSGKAFTLSPWLIQTGSASPGAAKPSNKSCLASTVSSARQTRNPDCSTLPPSWAHSAAVPQQMPNIGVPLCRIFSGMRGVSCQPHCSGRPTNDGAWIYFDKFGTSTETAISQ